MLFRKEALPAQLFAAHGFVEFRHDGVCEVDAFLAIDHSTGLFVENGRVSVFLSVIFTILFPVNGSQARKILHIPQRLYS